MNYSRIPPTEPGFYWMKWTSAAEPTIFQLIEPGHAFTIGDDCTWDASFGSALFGAKIEPPDEA